MKELRQKSTELKETLRDSLSPRHHAMLYAYIVRSCRMLPFDDAMLPLFQELVRASISKAAD